MVTLYDAHGQPIQSAALASDPQTAEVRSLYREFAEHPSSGLTVSRLATIMKSAEQGDLRSQAELFEDMEEKDAHIFAELSKRKRALIGLDWSIEPPLIKPTAQEKTAAEQVEEQLREIPDLEDLLFDLMDAVGKAYSFAEIEWHMLGRTWSPRAITHRPQSWFKLAPESHNELRLRDGSVEGQELRPLGWVRHIHKAKTGYVSRGGLHRVLAWPFLFKNYSVRDLAEFLEIYGLPVRVGTYPGGATDKEKATLMRAVMGIGHNAAGIIPEGMAIDFKEAAKGTQMPFNAMIDWCERSQSKAILGGTLTSQADGASSTNALGNVHNEVRHELTVSDAIQLAGTLTRDLCYPLALLNGTGVAEARRAPRFVFDTRECDDVVAMSEALPKLVSVGMKIPVSFAHERLGIPEAGKDEEVLTVQAPGQAAATARVGVAAATAHPPADELDVLADELAGDWEKVLDPVIGPILELAAASASFDDFQEGMAELLAKQDMAPAIESLAQGQFAANLWGRVNGDG